MYGLIAVLMLVTNVHVGVASPTLMRPAHVWNSASKAEVWAQMDVFKQSFDVINYAKKLGDSAKPSKMVMNKIGGNIYLDSQWLLRTEWMYGSQTIVRATKPTSMTSNLESAIGLIQWHAVSLPLIVEAGYKKEKFLPSGFKQYQKGSSLITAAPGKQLITSSSQASTWLGRVSAPIDISDIFHLQLGMEYQRSTVQTSYTSYDPMIVSLISGQIPQITPWHEEQRNLLFSLDVDATENLALGMDLAWVNIKRSSYQPRKGFRDYTSTQIVDVWASYDVTHAVTFFMRGHGNTHYLLGEMPSAYNSRINHKFKYPFGYLSAGLMWRL